MCAPQNEHWFTIISINLIVFSKYILFTAMFVLCCAQVLFGRLAIIEWYLQFKKNMRESHWSLKSNELIHFYSILMDDKTTDGRSRFRETICDWSSRSSSTDGLRLWFWDVMCAIWWWWCEWTPDSYLTSFSTLTSWSLSKFPGNV